MGGHYKQSVVGVGNPGGASLTASSCDLLYHNLNKQDVLRERKLHQDRCIVGENRGGALCWMRIHRINSPISFVNVGGKLILDLHPDSDQHQNLTTSWRSPLPRVYVPCLVDMRKRVRVSWVILLTDRLNNRQTDSTDRITPPRRSNSGWLTANRG